MSRVPLLVVASAVLAATLSGCGAGSAPAATVAGRDITREDLNRDLRALRDNKELARLVAQQGGTLTDTKGTVTATLAAGWLSQLVQNRIVHDAVTKRRLRLTASDRQAARQSIPNSFGTDATFNAFPKSFRDRYLQGAAEIQALYHAVEGTPTTSEEAQAAQQRFLTYLTDSMKRAKVKVDHRYGSVRFTDQGFQIVPPAAPNPREKPATTTTTALNPLGPSPSG